VVAAFIKADYLWLIPATVLYAISIWGKVVRWRLLFYPRQDIRQSRLFAAMMVGYMGNTILPARLGEVARAYLVSKAERGGKIGEVTEGTKSKEGGEEMSVTLALSTIVVEKILDILILLLFLALLLPFVALPTWVQRSSLILGLAFLALFAVIMTFAYQRERMLRFIGSVLQLVPYFHKRGSHAAISHRPSAITSQLVTALSGFAVLRQTQLHITLWGWSLAIWGVSALFVYSVMLAFHIAAPFTAAVLLLCVTNLGMTVPSSPGYIGVYHYLVVTVLLLFGVGRELALSYAFVLHLLAFLPVSLLGVFYVGKGDWIPRTVQELE
jgi:uncharacterized protein (TIRG00374 family)